MKKDFINIDPRSGNNNGTIIVDCEANTTTSDRYTSVNVIGGLLKLLK